MFPVMYHLTFYLRQGIGSSRDYNVIIGQDGMRNVTQYVSIIWRYRNFLKMVLLGLSIWKKHSECSYMFVSWDTLS